MELLCINAKIIESHVCIHEGLGLIEGKIYATICKMYNNEYGQPVFYIEGIGQKLACRFVELLDNEEKANIAISEIKKEFQLN